MNILPQTEAVAVTSSITALEARQLIEQIKGHLNSIRVLLLDLDERRGWEVLGYQSMRQCLIGEFNRSEARLPQLWRELRAGRIEKHLVPMGTIGNIPERQLREIGKLPPERWSSAWEEAQATAPPKGVTTSHVAKTVAKTKSELALSSVRDSELTPSRNGVAPIQSRFKSGDWILIDCPRSADLEQRRHNGCWGRVLDVAVSGNPKVEVGSNTVLFMASDLQVLVNPSPAFVQVAEKVVGLLKRSDLDEFERKFLTLYLQQQTFTERQMEMLAGIVDHYETNHMRSD